DLRIHNAERAVGRLPLPIERPLNARTGGEVLGVLRGVTNRVGLKQWNAHQKRVKFLCLGVVDLALNSEDGIEGLYLSSFAEGRLDETAGAGCRSARRDDGTRRGRSGGAERAAHAGVHTEGDTAGFGAGEIGKGRWQVIAERGQIEIVFDGEGNRILKRDVELSVADQIFEPRRVMQVERRRGAGPIRGKRVAGVWQFDMKCLQRPDRQLLLLLN